LTQAGRLRHKTHQRPRFATTRRSALRRRIDFACKGGKTFIQGRTPLASTPIKFSHIPPVKHARRTWLKQAGALAGAASLPLLGVSAFTFAQSKLNGLPRIALVMGNTRYRDAPLKNPVNDAKAIANELQQTEFRVSLQLDAGRAQMSGAIQSFTDDLAKTKGVGLFYYAGHGAQLAWRNYLIPVDAAIEKHEVRRLG